MEARAPTNRQQGQSAVARSQTLTGPQAVGVVGPPPLLWVQRKSPVPEATRWLLVEPVAQSLAARVAPVAPELPVRHQVPLR